MLTQHAPRDYTPGAGLPGDRSARIAARQAFVSLKLTFLEALDPMPDAEFANLGLFPLAIVLLPGERMPLHIFEPRYRELIADCTLGARPFVLSNLKTLTGLAEVVAFVEARGMLKTA